MLKPFRALTAAAFFQPLYGCGSMPYDLLMSDRQHAQDDHPNAEARHRQHLNREG